MNQRIAVTTSQTIQLLEQFGQQQSETLAGLAQQLAGVFASGGQMLLAGVGPRLPLAQLLASHFTYRLGFDRPALPALALGSDPVLAGIMADSEAADQLLVRHHRSAACEQQMLLLLNDGSNCAALRLLRDEVLDQGHPVALITPNRQDDPLCSDGVGFCLSLGTNHPARQLELALFSGQLLCELVEAELFGV